MKNTDKVIRDSYRLTLEYEQLRNSRTMPEFRKWLRNTEIVENESIAGVKVN